ncbi:hypothetical protein CCMSSC00406_0007548 [Pleurotus cornucopiae]|uniref:Uncharacterized protein n=1 Tax=Pleurotus cornucopiae TaxID=5321 RepID=A0ACB7J6T4_PLECO|nr:hypothetical protein CCMSSC00406_0007548 [Pleurotus cornucopiae]
MWAKEHPGFGSTAESKRVWGTLTHPASPFSDPIISFAGTLPKTMRATPFLRNVGPGVSAALRERVRRPSMLKKLTSPEALAPLFKNDDYIGWSGFTGVGYPKCVPTAIADHTEQNNLQADPATKRKFNLFVGASVGPEVEDRWAHMDMIARRYPHQVGKEVSKGINAGRIEFADKHLSMFPQDLTYGYYSLKKQRGDPRKPLDWAIVEATAITEEGHIVPGASVGATPEILESAEKIIIEVNTRVPNLEGLHDIVHSFAPPNKQPYLITHPSNRIGSTAIPIDTERVVAIVESTHPDNTGTNAPENDESKAIAKHLIHFLSEEVAAGRLPKSLLPLQSGIGNVANSIIGGLADGPFEKVQVWTEAQIEEVVDKLMELYPDIPALGSPYNTGNETFGLSSQYKRLGSLLGDLTFVAPVRLHLKALAKADVKLYSYLFTEDSGARPPQEGIAHTDEIAYVYGQPPAPVSPSSARLTGLIMDYWLSFAYEHHPNDGRGHNRQEWLPYTEESPVLMQLNGVDLRMIPDNYREEQINFIISKADVLGL